MAVQPHLTTLDHQLSRFLLFSCPACPVSGYGRGCRSTVRRSPPPATTEHHREPPPLVHLNPLSLSPQHYSAVKFRLIRTGCSVVRTEHRRKPHRHSPEPADHRPSPSLQAVTPTLPPSLFPCSSRGNHGRAVTIPVIGNHRRHRRGPPVAGNCSSPFRHIH